MKRTPQANLGRPFGRSLRPSAFGPRPSRPGFTLIEILLVMGLLVIVAAVVVPNILTIGGLGKLREQGDRVQAQLVGLRLRAIEDGRQYRLEFTPGAADYRIFANRTVRQQQEEAARRTDGAGAAADGTMPDRSAEFDAAGLVGEHKLEDGMTFGTSDAATQQAGQDFLVDPLTDAANLGSGVILFRPDGTATGRVFWIADKDGMGTVFEVERGTGVVKRSSPVAVNQVDPLSALQANATGRE